MKKGMRTAIVILYEMKHVDIVLAYFGIEKLKQGRGPVVVPTSYEIETALHDRNIPFYSMVGHRARSSLKERFMLASSMMRQLYTDPAFDFFEHDGIRLGRIVGYSLGEYILRVLYYLDVGEFILDRFKGIGVVYVPESATKVSSTAGQLATFEIRAPADTMSFLAKRRNISLLSIPCPQNVAAENKIHNFVGWCARSLLIASAKLFNGVMSVFRAQNAMKIFVSDYWWHIDSFITKMKGVEITMMERKEIRNVRSFVWKYKVRFNHPSDYATYRTRHRAEEKRKYYEKMWLKLGTRPKFSEQFVWYGVHFWEVVRPAYEHLITSFSKNVVETIETSGRLFKKQNIEAVILRASVSGQIHFPTLGLVARKMGIPAIELQHGLEYSEESSLSVRKNANILASYGPLVRRELENVSGGKVRVLDIGSPRFDQYRNEKIEEDAKSNILKKMNLDALRPIFLYIATDIVLGQTHDTHSMLALFKNIASAVRCIKGMQVIIKIRPGPATENFFKQTIPEVFDGNCRIAQYENLHELISISNVVASSFSTVVLEAMIAEKPVVLVGIDENDRMLMESHFLPYEQAQALRIARTSEELAQYARAIILDPNEAETIVRNARNFLKKNFCFDGKSSERVAALLNDLSRQSKG